MTWQQVAQPTLTYLGVLAIDGPGDLAALGEALPPEAGFVAAGHLGQNQRKFRLIIHARHAVGQTVDIPYDVPLTNTHLGWGGPGKFNPLRHALVALNTRLCLVCTHLREGGTSGADKNRGGYLLDTGWAWSGASQPAPAPEPAPSSGASAQEIAAAVAAELSKRLSS